MLAFQLFNILCMRIELKPFKQFLPSLDHHSKLAHPHYKLFGHLAESFYIQPTIQK